MCQDKNEVSVAHYCRSPPFWVALLLYFVAQQVVRSLPAPFYSRLPSYTIVQNLGTTILCIFDIFYRTFGVGQVPKAVFPEGETCDVRFVQVFQQVVADGPVHDLVHMVEIPEHEWKIQDIYRRAEVTQGARGDNGHVDAAFLEINGHFSLPLVKELRDYIKT